MAKQTKNSSMYCKWTINVVFEQFLCKQKTTNISFKTTLPLCKIPLFSEIAVTFKILRRFLCPLIFRISYNLLTQSIILLEAPSQTVWAWQQCKDIFKPQLDKVATLEQALPCQPHHQAKNRFTVPLSTWLKHLNQS